MIEKAVFWGMKTQGDLFNARGRRENGSFRLSIVSVDTRLTRWGNVLLEVADLTGLDGIYVTPRLGDWLWLYAHDSRRGVKP